MLAVIATGGKQYIVREQQTLRIEKLPEVSRKNGKVTFSEVLLTEDKSGKISVGTPHVSSAKVEASILSDGKEERIRVVKYKAKTRHKRTRGHRQPFTEVRIEKIVA